MGKVHTKEKEEILSWNKNKIKQKSLELSGLFQPRWFYDCVMWQDFFKAAWFSINIFVLVRQVLGWIYKNLHIMRPLRLQENRNTSSSPKALTLIKEMEAEVLYAQFRQAETLPRKCFSALKPHQKKKRAEILFPVNFSIQKLNLLSKIETTFFPAKIPKNYSLCLRLPERVNEKKVTKLKQWGFCYFQWKALQRELSFKCKWAN